MALTYIEKRENRLKHGDDVAESLLKEIAKDIGNEDKLNQTTLKKLLSVTNKL